MLHSSKLGKLGGNEMYCHFDNIVTELKNEGLHKSRRAYRET